VLKHCSTEVAKGEVVVVCGPSGSGKSTLIKCVNGLEPF
jgi:glutamate/aspartate transport system ATP-binding protein